MRAKKQFVDCHCRLQRHAVRSKELGNLIAVRQAMSAKVNSMHCATFTALSCSKFA